MSFHGPPTDAAPFTETSFLEALADGAYAARGVIYAPFGLLALRSAEGVGRARLWGAT